MMAWALKMMALASSPLKSLLLTQCPVGRHDALGDRHGKGLLGTVPIVAQRKSDCPLPESGSYPSAVLRPEEEKVGRGLERIAEAAGHPPSQIVGAGLDVRLVGPGQVSERGGQFPADVVEDQVPVGMVGGLVVCQFRWPEAELRRVHVPLPTAGVLFPKGQVDQTPAASDGRARVEIEFEGYPNDRPLGEGDGIEAAKRLVGLEVAAILKAARVILTGRPAE
jgi:hypothetical protein